MKRIIPLALAGVFMATPVYAQDTGQAATVPVRPSTVTTTVTTTVTPAASAEVEPIPVSPTHTGKSAVTVVPSVRSELPKGYPRDAVTGKPIDDASESQKSGKESLRDRIRDRMTE